MRALLSTIGSRGDVQPLVALSLELRALGQEVRLCAPPDFCDWIESLGIPAFPIGPELRTLTASGPPALPTPERRRQLAEATVAAQFEAVADAAKGCDCIVAATALQIAARSVADAMGIRYVFVVYCPTVVPSPHHPPPPLPPVPGEPPAGETVENRELWTRDTARFNVLFGPPLNVHRASLGLSPVDDVRTHVFGDRPWLAADQTLAPWPDPADQSVLQTGPWILSDARPLCSELEAFLDVGEPPLYFGLGSMRAPQGLGEVMIQVARRLGRRAIVSRGWATLSLVDDGPDCMAIGEVNQQLLFKQVAAVVHHGGAGTTTAAALAGAPQVVIPQLYDQHYWARRIHELGIGSAHPSGPATIETLGRAVSDALQPQVRARAQSIAGLVQRDGAQAAARRLITTDVTRSR